MGFLHRKVKWKIIATVQKVEKTHDYSFSTQLDICRIIQMLDTNSHIYELYQKEDCANYGQRWHKRSTGIVRNKIEKFDISTHGVTFKNINTLAQEK